MKILQSPYYQPRKLLSASSEPPYTVQLIEDSLQYASKYNPFESLLDDIFPGVHVGNHDMVIRKEQLKDFGKSTPMGRMGQPSEVAPAYLFLASEEASYISGQVIHVNGGSIING